ncbi:MAG: hypothetical protein PHT40_03200 [Patescibacteria group bacterium]|nr:hypothetical protein [Patescibacteria group bacterium]
MLKVVETKDTLIRIIDGRGHQIVVESCSDGIIVKNNSHDPCLYAFKSAGGLNQSVLLLKGPEQLFDWQNFELVTTINNRVPD